MMHPPRTHEFATNRLLEQITMHTPDISNPSFVNRCQVGQALREVLSEGAIKREDLFITSKLWYVRYTSTPSWCMTSHTRIP